MEGIWTLMVVVDKKFVPWVYMGLIKSKRLKFIRISGLNAI